MTTADVVIVGGGIEGTAAAWALSQRGVTDVFVAERNTVASGMTGKSSGIVRCHYGVSSLAAMAAVGLEVFEKADEMFGTDIGFRQTGYVVGVGEPNVGSMRKSLAAQRAVGVQTEEIDRADVAEMWPFADLSAFAAFGWEPRGGYGDAYQTAQAFAAAARGAGVRIRQGANVTGLVVDGDAVKGIRLADDSTVSTGTVVVATGVWTSPFLAPYGVDVPITVVREQIVTIAPGVEAEATRSLPVFSDLVSLQYVRPEVSGDILFGNSDLSDVEEADPDDYLNRATEAFVDITVEKVGTRFPGFSGAAIRASYAGCYDVTPDWNPVISKAPLDGLYVAAGFSGHGFKISPAVGRLVADLVIDGRSGDPRIPETDFRLSRFAENDLLKSPFPYVGAGQMR
jgi:glycine/D-amino acid oxidase-like deaminating enzyme